MEYFHWPAWLAAWLCSFPAPARLLISSIWETAKSPWFHSNNWKHQCYQHSSCTKSKTQQLLDGKLTLFQLKSGQCWKVPKGWPFLLYKLAWNQAVSKLCLCPSVLLSCLSPRWLHHLSGRNISRLYSWKKQHFFAITSLNRVVKQLPWLNSEGKERKTREKNS